MRRRARKPPVREVGEDPDYRFTLANERTFLAWVRTALALLAGGVAVATVLPEFGPEGSRRIVGVLLMAFSAGIAAFSYWRWERNERAMRQGHPLAPTPLARLMAGGVTLVAVAVALLIVLGR